MSAQDWLQLRAPTVVSNDVAVAPERLLEGVPPSLVSFQGVAPSLVSFQGVAPSLVTAPSMTMTVHGVAPGLVVAP